ncbi:MAG: SGNH/GDSL hydrolase family protein [Armatimonadetes bacterium]|nr:SGNH/GDSL hydrolase family protein [Armatimonadota bacterium]
MSLTFLLPASLLALSLAPDVQPPQPVSIPVVQTREGLAHVFTKLKARKPVTVAWFGGSITEGAGASNGDETSYRGLVGHWFTTTFPQSHVTNVNAAIGGTGSDLGAFRLGRDVLAHRPDLVFVEFAVNDGGAPEAMIDRAMEGIVRQIRRADPDTDICFVYTFVVGWLPEFQAGRLVHSVQRDEIVAAHYGLPSVNMAVPAARKLIDGAMTAAEFSKDGVHPTDAGYRIYADALIAFLTQQRDDRARPHKRRLPPALRPDSLEHARMIGADTITPAPGWAVTDRDSTGRFPHLLASDTPGATQTVGFSGPILAMFYVLGPDTGAFDYKIDDGPWQTLDPFDVFAKGYARAHYRLLADGLPDTPHTLTLKIRADHNPDSKGTYTRIGYLLTSPGHG